jgi:hypothetical protein
MSSTGPSPCHLSPSVLTSAPVGRLRRALRLATSVLESLCGMLAPPLRGWVLYYLILRPGSSSSLLGCLLDSCRSTPRGGACRGRRCVVPMGSMLRWSTPAICYAQKRGRVRVAGDDRAAGFPLTPAVSPWERGARGAREPFRAWRHRRGRNPHLAERCRRPPRKRPRPYRSE